MMQAKFENDRLVIKLASFGCSMKGNSRNFRGGEIERMVEVGTSALAEVYRLAVKVSSDKNASFGIRQAAQKVVHAIGEDVGEPCAGLSVHRQAAKAQSERLKTGL